MRYSLLAGGKRIRPVLALADGALARASSPESVLPAAAAIELIHTYSLIHDDLPAMDDDELRRGRPTSHVSVRRERRDPGRATGCSPRRFACSPSASGRARPRSSPRWRELLGAIGVDGMVGGQYVDVTAGSTSSDARTRAARACTR